MRLTRGMQNKRSTGVLKMRAAPLSSGRLHDIASRMPKRERSARVPGTRCPQPLGGRRKGCAFALEVDRRLEGIGHLVVHDVAVPVALEVGGEALVRSAPVHAADLAAPDGPAAEAVEGPEDFRGGLVRHEVHECIAKRSPGSEIHRQIHKIKELIKA